MASRSILKRSFIASSPELNLIDADECCDGGSVAGAMRKGGYGVRLHKGAKPTT